MGMYIFSPALVQKQENASSAYEIASQLGYKETPDNKRKLLKFYKNLNIELLIMLRPEVLFRKVERSLSIFLNIHSNTHLKKFVLFS